MIDAARALSLIGHPAVVMPLAVYAAAASRGLAGAALASSVIAAAAVATIVVIVAIVKVRSGRWAHVDASAPDERVGLNRLLVALLAGVAAVTALLGGPPLLVAGPALCAAIVIVALALRRHLKLSLHAAFAAHAALLLWPHAAAVLLLGALALAVGWSRLRLGRHTMAEVGAGLACGALAGGAFAWLAAPAS